MQGLTGLATIDLLGGSPGSPPLTMTDGEPYPVIPSRPSLLVRLDSVISDLLGNLIEMSNKVNAMLDVFLIDLALKKLTFELVHAPERIRVPARALLELAK